MTLKAQTGPLEALLDRLAELDASEFPVLSLYLDARPDEHGKDRFGAFVRKELSARGATFHSTSPERESYERDVERIRHYLRNEVDPAANGIAIFACSAAELFEPLQLEAPFPESRLFVASQPHLYPLARLIEAYPRYAALVADTRSARIFVFGLQRTLRAETVESSRVRRTMVGGWSQMRYQRHVDEVRAHHIREGVEALERIVREEALEHVILAGDEVAIPLLRAELPKPLAEKLVDVLKLPVTASERDVLVATLEAFRRHDARTDVEIVQRVLDEYRSGGLTAVGVADARAALAVGQADELILSASPASLGDDGEAVAEELVTQARQTSAAITFIDDPELLAPVGGVAVMLRYRVTPDGPAVVAKAAEATPEEQA
jgi:peptide subunit release factor 1 (eRF1)